MVNLNPKYIKFITSTLQKHLNKDTYRYFIFGSHATGSNRKYSDIDIGIVGKMPVELHTLSHIKGAMEESDIPYRVDIVDFSKVDSKFKKVAQSEVYYLH